MIYCNYLVFAVFILIFINTKYAEVKVNIIAIFFFTATIRRVPKMFHCGCRQCRVSADAADPYLAPWSQHCAHGQKHHDEESHQRSSRN